MQVRRDKRKVIHVIPVFAPGGAERLVLNLLESKDSSSFEMLAVSLYPPSGTIFEELILQQKMPVIFLDKKPGLDLRMIPSLYFLFKSLQPDVVHTHIRSITYAFLAAKMARVPVLVHTIHNIALQESDALGRLFRRLAFRMGVIPVSVSWKVHESVKNTYGIESTVIYNGIPCARYVGHMRELADDELILINIARFVPQKNHECLILAFAKAYQQYPHMRLLLVGDGPLRKHISDLVTNMGLVDVVHFLGIRDDVPELLMQSDALVLSSEWEGFPMVILEAFAAGKPVIATNVGGVAEIVENGMNGILIPPGDIDALAKAICDLASDTNMRRNMGQNGQVKARREFDISVTARQYENLYLTALEKGRHRNGHCVISG
jgi:glycosyltransferase involved in cell wall biosynthesis